MLGIALSLGATAPLLSEPELAQAAGESSVPGLSSVDTKDVDTKDSEAVSLVPRLAIETAESASTAYHTVEAGESLWQIAEQHQADVQVIKAANGISPEEVLRVGQVIRVPVMEFSDPAEAVGGPRLALSSTVRGGVGGDLSASNSANGADAVAVLSVSELEQAWASGEDMSLPLHGNDKELDEALTAADPDNSDPLSSALSAQAEENPLNQLAALSDRSTPEAAAGALLAVEATPTESSVADQGTTASEPTLTASLPLADVATTAEADHSAWQDAAVQPAAAPTHNAASGVDASVETSPQPVTVAVLAPEARNEVESLASGKPEGATQTYQVKPGDTFWSVASRHGLSTAELLSHNEAVQQPEAIAVGDQLAVPVTASAEPVTTAPDESTTVVASATSRDQEIRSHLERIRASSSTSIDREEINARIRRASQTLEQTRALSNAPQARASQTQAEPLASSPSPSRGDNREISFRISGASAALEPKQETVTDGGWTVTDVAGETPVTEIALSAGVAESIDDSDSTSAVAVDAGRQLLAAAPMGADVYRSNPNLPVGQTVSPNMPMLPGASEFLPEAPNRFNGYIWPTQGTFTSGYGWRWGRMHRGVDIAGPVGTPIVAAASGVVVSAGWNSGGYGNMVDIRHADGSLTRYAHNSRLMVRSGEQVNQGQQIAAMGSTGFSTGPHLHFEVHLPNAGTVNPMAYLPGR